MSTELSGLVLSRVGAHVVAVDAAAVRCIGGTGGGGDGDGERNGGASGDGCDAVSAAAARIVDLAHHFATPAPSGARCTLDVSSSARTALLIAGGHAEVTHLPPTALLPTPALIAPLLSRLGVMGLLETDDALALLIDPVCVVDSADGATAAKEGLR